MNGYTVALRTKKMDILPCKKYKIIIAICDVGDSGFNSAVFLEANSFNATNINFKQDTQHASITLSGDTIVGCSPTTSLTVNVQAGAKLTETKEYEIVTGGNMISGVDYSPFSTSIKYNIGDSIKTINMDLYPDPVSAAGQVKTLKLYLYGKECNNKILVDSSVIYFKTPSPFQKTSIKDSSMCSGSLPQTGSFTFNTTGGVENLTYQWSAGATPTAKTNSIIINQSMQVNVKATDLCNRIVADTFNIFIDQIYGDTITAAICKGETYNLFGFNETTTGLHSQKLKTAGGCDSIVILDLTVNPVYKDTISAVICEGETYNLFGFSETTTGFHPQNLTTTAGCDSIIILDLTVNPVYNDTIIATICDGNTYNLFGFSETTTGVYSQNLTTTAACDSIIVLNLTVNPAYKDTIVAEICKGQTYNLFGFNENTTGYFTQSLTTVAGCDSIVVLDLTVNPVYKDTIDAAICDGETYNLFGFNETTTGYYTQSLSTVAGCDSIVTLNLTVNPVYNDTIIAVICEGDTYNLFGFNANTTGFHPQNLTTVAGCDSIRVLDLTVNPVYKDTITADICLGDSYTQFGFNENTTGIYDQHLQTINSCDSIVTLKLTVNLPADTTLYDDICQHETYTKNGFNVAIQNNVGTFPFQLNLKTHKGCDSTVYLNLTVNPIKDTIVYDTICQYQSYTKKGFNVPMQENVGTFPYQLNLKTQKGCDSTVYLNLTVNKVERTYLYDQICRDNAYNDKGFTISAAQNNKAGIFAHSRTLQTVNGCDSIIVLYLTVNPTHGTVMDQHVCLNSPYNAYGFSLPSQTTAGGPFVHYLYLTDSNGCDSTVILNLYVHEPDSSILYANVCVNEPYDDKGFSIAAQGTPGMSTHELHLKSQYGCDSTVLLYLTVNPTDKTILYDTIYINEPYYANGFNIPIQHIAGQYENSLLLSNQFACDSSVYLYLWIDDCPVIPDNFFTPNGDGLNDYWTIQGSECGVDWVEIYDRHGKLILRKEEFISWDGTLNNKKMASDDYWYLISLKSNKKKLIGHFTLKR